MSDTRFFTIESAEIKLPEDYQGRFQAKTPYNAGIKAVRQLFRLAPKKKAIRFVLRETTLGSLKKEFHYVGMKQKLDQPRVIVRDGTQITINFVYSVKACK
jgi:hypothetical protein